MDLLREKLRVQFHHVARCADAPDMTAQVELAKGNVELGKEALAWYKQQAEEQKPMIQRAADRADQVSLAQLESMKTQTDLSKEYADYSRNTFRPVEKRLVSDAMSFNTEAERERLAGLAAGDTAQAFGAARSQMRRDIGRAGINPADGAYTASLKDLASREALDTARGKNKARSDARTVGRAMLADAASLGRGLPSQQATSAQLAISAGDRAVGNAQVPISLATQNAQLAGAGYGTALQANNAASNIYGQVSSAQAGTDAANGQTAMAGGTAIAGIAMAI
jgi:hypothetical protein